MATPSRKEELSEIIDYLAFEHVARENTEVLQSDLAQTNFALEKEAFQLIENLAKINNFWPERVVYTLGDDKHRVAIINVPLITPATQETTVRYFAATYLGIGEIIINVPTYGSKHVTTLHSPVGNTTIDNGTWSQESSMLATLNAYFQATSARNFNEHFRAFFITGTDNLEIEFLKEKDPAVKIPIQISTPENSHQAETDLQEILSLLMTKRQEEINLANQKLDQEKARLETSKRIGYTLVSVGLSEPEAEKPKPNPMQRLREKLKRN